MMLKSVILYSVCMGGLISLMAEHAETSLSQRQPCKGNDFSYNTVKYLFKPAQERMFRLL